MKTKRNYLALPLLFCMVLLFPTCSQNKHYDAQESYEMSMSQMVIEDETADMADQSVAYNTVNFTAPQVDGGSATVVDLVTTKAASAENDGDKKFIRTAHLNLVVTDVVKATHAIEDIIIAKKGFIISSIANNEEFYSTETKVSKDSVLVESYNKYSANISLRVKYMYLDEALRQIALCAEKVKYRNVNANDVTFSLIANKLEQDRKSDKSKRVKDISGPNKGYKLDDLLDAEDSIDRAREAADNAKINELKMLDQIEYSSITINLEQEPVVFRTMKYVEPEVQKYHSNFFWKALEAIEVGWAGLLTLVVGLLYLWPLMILGAGVFFAIVYYRKKRKK